MKRVVNVSGSISPNASQQTSERLRSYFPNFHVHNLIFDQYDNNIYEQFSGRKMSCAFVGDEMGAGQIKLLQEIVQEKHVDLIHIYGGPTLHAPIPVFLSKILREPVITRFNGFTNPNQDIKKILATKLERALIKHSDAVVFNSHGQKERILKTYGIDYGDSKYVVPPGIRGKKFYQNSIEQTTQLRSRLGIQPNDKVIGIVQTPRPVKQPKVAVDILEKLNNKMNSKVHLVAVGGSPHIKKYKDYAIRKGLKNRTHWVGFKPREKLSNWYSMFDVTIMTSKMESFGMSITESYLCKTPCIAFDVGGMADQILDGKSGYLIEFGNQEEFTRKCNRLLSDELIRTKFGECGKEFVEKRFLMDNAKKKYTKILAELESL